MSDIDWSDPTVCLEKVREDGYDLKYVKYQTPDLCLIALNRSPHAFANINNRSQRYA